MCGLDALRAPTQTRAASSISAASPTILRVPRAAHARPARLRDSRRRSSGRVFHGHTDALLCHAWLSERTGDEIVCRAGRTLHVRPWAICGSPSGVERQIRRSRRAELELPAADVSGVSERTQDRRDGRVECTSLRPRPARIIAAARAVGASRLLRPLARDAPHRRNDIAGLDIDVSAARPNNWVRPARGACSAASRGASSIPPLQATLQPNIRRIRLELARAGSSRWPHARRASNARAQTTRRCTRP